MSSALLQVTVETIVPESEWLPINELIARNSGTPVPFDVFNYAPVASKMPTVVPVIRVR